MWAVLYVFGGFPDLPGFTLNSTVNLIGNEIVFELAAQEEGIVLNEINWPKAAGITGNSAQDLAVIPRMQGMLIPGNWPQAIHGKDLSNSRSFYMPWWGQIRNGHGVQPSWKPAMTRGASIIMPRTAPPSSRPSGMRALEGCVTCAPAVMSLTIRPRTSPWPNATAASCRSAVRLFR